MSYSIHYDKKYDPICPEIQKKFSIIFFSFNGREGGSIMENSIRFIFFYFDGLLEDTAASRLYRALHGDRTDVSAVIEILTSHSRQQRNKISKAYKFNHNKVKGRYLRI